MSDPTPVRHPELYWQEEARRCLRRAEHWHDIAERRVRLAWAALALGIIIGIIAQMIIATPPVWIDDITAAATQCRAL